MIIDLSTAQHVEYEHVGGKAYNLHKLLSLGIPVPAAVVVSPHFSLEDDESLSILANHPLLSSGGLFAVRSSGVGEDSEANSYAGVFDTFLDVAAEEIPRAISAVRKSMHSEHSKNYSAQRGASIENMGVVVQRMVPAEFAGVAFTASPIEKDSRIMLIEMVAGLGESLVSGKVTPTTIRYNKLTKQQRIEQVGAHGLGRDVTSVIVGKLVPMLDRIERHYGHPVDVEWAYSQDDVYILQARPITV